MSGDDTGTLTRVCVLLAVLVNEVRELRRDLADRKSATRKPRTLAAGDIAMLTDLLPAIVATMGGAAATVRSLHVAASARTAEAKSLRAALDATGLNSLQLGRLLRRAMESETPCSGFYVHRIGASRDGVTFIVNAEPRETHSARFIARALSGK
ncbi:MAG: hypothetical protein A3H32_14375 [Betaproteobacteria bacterium RIFCSPLOWO2_02_FULL_63_19]|nr:MAG: hypothetical protein A3H32_14375 [Betaproteobacteria bacterium RIFCSPLOWO2_02_FULL_63_19]